MTSGESMTEERHEATEFSEDRTPLEGIEEAVEDLVEFYGGSIESRSPQKIHFVLPERRGVAAAGGLGCTVSWEGEPASGTVSVVADRDVRGPKFQQVALLLVGTVGALLWILWPFFPGLGALSWIGGVMAFATWFIAKRRSQGGVVARFLEHLVRVQRER